MRENSRLPAETGSGELTQIDQVRMVSDPPRTIVVQATVTVGLSSDTPEGDTPGRFIRTPPEPELSRLAERQRHSVPSVNRRSRRGAVLSLFAVALACLVASAGFLAIIAELLGLVRS